MKTPKLIHKTGFTDAGFALVVIGMVAIPLGVLALLDALLK